MSNNDERILALKKQIDEKRKIVGRASRFAPITNCILQMDGQTYNLHVCCDELLLVKLNALAMSASDLGLSIYKLTISGFSLADWIEDVKGLIEAKMIKEEKAKLDKLEKQLDSLLSSDKRTELEIDNIAALLN